MGDSDEDLQINKDLYEALMKKDDAKVIDICASIPKGPLHTVTIHEDTVLHIATYHKKNNLVLSLLSMVPAQDSHKLTWQNKSGSTILHETGTNNKMLGAAKEMLRRAPMLLGIINKQGETALFYAARHGKTKIFKYLHDEVIRTIAGPDLNTFVRRDDKSTILHLAILSKNYWMAHEIAIKHKHLINKKDEDKMTPLQLLSCRQLETCPTNIFMRMIHSLIDPNIEDTSWMLKPIKKLRKKKFACQWATKLITLLVQNDTSWEKTEARLSKSKAKFHQYGKSSSTTQLQEEIVTYESATRSPDTPLILATKNGCTEIVKEILEQYPQAIEHIDQDGRNILHVAILHRNDEVFDYVVSTKYARERLRGKIDNEANTLLHMVAEEEEDDLDADLKGPAYVLRDNIRMFKKVENLCTTLDRFKLNSRQKNAEQLFRENNNARRMEAQTWMMENSKNYSVVAVLIATVAFAAEYTIPGGPNPETGEPILKSKPMFKFFLIADAMSLSAALTSIIIFLNIITSSYRFKDFENSLLRKMNAGVTMLMISLAMLMVAFAATLILTISGGRKWTDITLYAISFFPVIVFTFMYLGIETIMVPPMFGFLKRILKRVGSLFLNSKPKPPVWYSGQLNSSSHPPSVIRG